MRPGLYLPAADPFPLSSPKLFSLGSNHYYVSPIDLAMVQKGINSPLLRVAKKYPVLSGVEYARIRFCGESAGRGDRMVMQIERRPQSLHRRSKIRRRTNAEGLAGQRTDRPVHNVGKIGAAAPIRLVLEIEELWTKSRGPRGQRRD